MWRDDSAVRHDSNPDWGCVLDPKRVQNVLAAQAFPQQRAYVKRKMLNTF